jgi:hypothetical protein
MATDTMTDNELIAEFMGFERRAQGAWDNNEYAYTIKFPSVYNKLMIPSEMLFATSWDWLMPVVEKIAKIETNDKVYNGEDSYFDSYFPRTFGMINCETKEFMVRINRHPLHQSASLIEAAYKAVIEFIKWYNTQTSNLLQYTPEQLSLLVECIDDKIKDVRDDIYERESKILNAEDMSESTERMFRNEINRFFAKMDNLYGVRAAIVTNHQYVLRAAKPVMQ